MFKKKLSVNVKAKAIIADLIAQTTAGNIVWKRNYAAYTAALNLHGATVAVSVSDEDVIAMRRLFNINGYPINISGLEHSLNYLYRVIEKQSEHTQHLADAKAALALLH